LGPLPASPRHGRPEKQAKADTCLLPTRTCPTPPLLLNTSWLLTSWACSLSCFWEKGPMGSLHTFPGCAPHIAPTHHWDCCAIAPKTAPYPRLICYLTQPSGVPTNLPRPIDSQRPHCCLPAVPCPIYLHSHLHFCHTHITLPPPSPDL